MNNWIPISQLPESYKTDEKKFVVSARDIDLEVLPGKWRKFTSNAVIVWYQNGCWGLPYSSFIGWEYDWSPTHFVELENYVLESMKFSQVQPSRGPGHVLNKGLS